MRLDERVRAMDEPRWLASRYAAEADRTGLIVLYAFYYELARVRVAVTDQTMGQPKPRSFAARWNGAQQAI